MTTVGSTLAAASRDRLTILDVVVPVFNEEVDLERCVRRLHAYLATEFPYRARITIVDNGSSDSTLAAALALADALPDVVVIHLAEKGRGRAVKAAWSQSEARVLAYTDVDLSTDLAALLPLVAPLSSGHSDLAIGSRLALGARVVRGPLREVLSRGYNLLLRRALAARFTDAQCGFKTIRRDDALRLLPLVEDTGWFFDTELLVLAERAGLRDHEIPVAHVALFTALRPRLGLQLANAVALLVATVANTAMNRRVTFATTGRAGVLRHQLQGLMVSGLSLALTGGALAAAHTVNSGDRRFELAVLVSPTCWRQ
jgi:glycosyltransferase involved in cell wall biosynthesis